MAYFYMILAYNMSFYRLFKSENANLKFLTTLSVHRWLHAKMTKKLCTFARTVAYFRPFLACNIILSNAGFEF